MRRLRVHLIIRRIRQHNYGAKHFPPSHACRAYFHFHAGGETCLTCQVDCCGYKLANGTLTCCGDGFCNAAGGETCATCPGDCGACATCNKNLICEPALGEKCVNGTSGCSDCGTCGSGAYCGDGKCTSARKGYSETCGSCPTDCGQCSDPLFCGECVE